MNILRHRIQICKPSYPARQDIARPLHHREYVPFLTHPIPPGSKSIGNKKISYVSSAEMGENSKM